jgi:hypothetical protein
VSQRLEQTGTDQNGNVMRRESKKPRRFFRNDAGGRRSAQAQKFFSFNVQDSWIISHFLNMRKTPKVTITLA